MTVMSLPSPTLTAMSPLFVSIFALTGAEDAKDSSRSYSLLRELLVA
jgi:hypothetical protein